RHRRSGRDYSRGRRQKHSRDNPRDDRHRRGDEQYRRRLPDYRPHAENVQDQPPHEIMNSFAGSDLLLQITYLVAAVLFILSLTLMSSPKTARQGVWAGELGMLLAIVGTLLHHGIVDYRGIAIGLVLGSIIGVPLGLVHMTAVPPRPALSHAFGALCVTLVGTSEFYLRAPNVPPFMMAVLSAEVILGSLTFTGSLMAAGKLEEGLPQRPITYKGQNFVNFVVLGIAVVVAIILVRHPEHTHLFPVMLAIPLIFGVLMI